MMKCISGQDFSESEEEEADHKEDVEDSDDDVEVISGSDIY